MINHILINLSGGKKLAMDLMRKISEDWNMNGETKVF